MENNTILQDASQPANVSDAAPVYKQHKRNYQACVSSSSLERFTLIPRTTSAQLTSTCRTLVENGKPSAIKAILTTLVLHA